MVKRVMKKRKEKTKRLTYTEAQLVNAKYMGKTEPELDHRDLGSVEYGRFLNWYNYMSTREEAIVYLCEYLVKRGREEDALNLRKVPEWAISKTAGHVARIVDRGYEPPTDHAAFVDRYVADAMRHLPETESTTERRDAPEFENRETALLNGLEARIWFVDEFDVKAWATENRVNAKQAEIIRDFEQPRLNAIKDQTWKEGRRKRAVFQSIVDHMEHLMAIKKTVVRTPRKPRPVSVEKKHRVVQYQKNSAEIGITSVDPAKILGAKEVWLYNTKYKTITVLRGEALDVNRTSVIGYDESRSETRGVGRKFVEVVKNVVSYPPKRLEKLMGELKGTARPPANRMNENVVILRVS